MKETYLKILELLDTSIFQNYKIIDEEEIPIEQSELVTCIEHSITIKIEMLVDFSWYEPKKYNESEVTQIRSGWIWEFFSFDESKELYDLLAEIGYDDDFWKNWLNQSWGSPEYHQIWDGEELFEDDFFNSIEDAKEYRSVWIIKGTIEIEMDDFENES